MKLLLIATLFAFVMPASLYAQTPANNASAPKAEPADRQGNIDKLMAPVAGPSPMEGLVGVVLSTKDKDVKLESIPGSIGYTYAFVTALIFADFPDQHASVRITDPRPTIHIKLGVNPKGRVYLVKTEVNPKTDNRSVKLGHSGFGSFSGIQTPDAKWSIAVTMTQGNPGDWTLVPTADLAPGEYGVFTGPGAVMNAQPGATGGELYDFGVDTPPRETQTPSH
jgi:hypothetical protein